MKIVTALKIILQKLHPFHFFLNKEAKRLANSHKSLLLGEAINVDFLKRVTLPVQPGLKCEHIAGPLK